MLHKLLAEGKILARRFFFEPESGVYLSLLRIVLGCAMLTEALAVFPYLADLYGQYGYLQADLMETLTGVAIPGFLLKMGVAPEMYTALFKCFYIFHILGILLFLSGFKTRFVTVFVWFTQTVIMNSGYLSSYGVDRYFHNLLFLMLWFPVGEYFSIDCRLNKKSPEPTEWNKLGLRLVQIFLLLTYADAGYSKSHGVDWWSGEAVWRVLNQPEFRRFDFLWLHNYVWLAKLLSIGTIFLEMLYGIAVWIPWLGSLWVLGIIGMHLGIAATMGLSLFGVTLAGVNAIVFAPYLAPKNR